MNHKNEPCMACGGSGQGPDRCDGPGDVYQGKCDRCDGDGREPLDNCQRCKGAKGGVRGNENVVNGEVLCDYCDSELTRANQQPRATPLERRI